jgi:hypothetical protein
MASGLRDQPQLAAERHLQDPEQQVTEGISDGSHGEIPFVLSKEDRTHFYTH